jgi:hypothetical protein
VKPFALIIFSIAGSLALVAVGMTLAHQPINPVDPATAALIGIASAVLGLLPILRSGRQDLVSVLQMAIVGTVLHLLVQVVLAGAMFMTHTVSPHGSFLIWLLAEYWASLAVLIFQLRKIILSVAPVAKVNP